MARILFVDDDPMIREVGRIMLSQLAFEVTVATNGDEAIKILSEQQFDCLVTDRMMPGVDGERLIAWVRNTSQHKGLPCLLLTGDDPLGINIDAEILQKPFTTASLKVALQSLAMMETI